MNKRQKPGYGRRFVELHAISKRQYIEASVAGQLKKCVPIPRETGPIQFDNAVFCAIVFKERIVGQLSRLRKGG
jgi:hypothetical protein